MVAKILLVEDNPGDARLIQEMLAEGVRETGRKTLEITWVPRLAEAVEHLDRSDTDLVLLDLGLPDSQGLDTFLRAYVHAPQVPFVVLSGLDDDAAAISAVRQGAQDYLLKGETDGNLLRRAIHYACERKKIEEALSRRTAELERANAELRQQIAKRQQTDEKLQSERQRLYALLDRLPTFVYLKAPDYLVRFANQSFRAHFGDWEGLRCYETIFQRQAPCRDCRSFRVLENGNPQTFEWTLPRSGGTFEVHNYPFTDADGTPLVMTMGIDISARRQAEKALKESEQKYRRLVNTLPAVVFHGYADGSIDFFDQKVEEITGYSKKEFDCRSCRWTDLILEEDRTGAKEAFAAALKGDRTYVREYRIRHKDGHIIWIQGRGQIFLGADGKIDHISGVLFDISERKWAEEQLRESEKNLRYLASQLLTAQERERKRISLELHDDLGQSLLVLKLKTRAMERKISRGPEAVKDECREMAAALDRIVEDVRRLSRDLSPSILEDLGLSAALRHLLEEFGRHNRLVTDSELDEIDDLFLPEARINIFRIFQEALTNIGKYAQASQLTIKIARQGKQVVFFIDDDGRGFNQEKIRTLGAADRGLGLAAMEERVRMLGGVLEIRSREGKGTTVSFVVPIPELSWR